MSKTLYRINGMLSNVVRAVPIGTNLGIVYLLWAIMSGRLLESRGAVFPALDALGLSRVDVCRGWRAMWRGVWSTQDLIDHWQEEVDAEGVWQAHAREGWRPVAVDLVGFFRPRLAGLETKHYDSTAGKALPAIPFGFAVRVGSVGETRLGVPLAIERMPSGETSEARLQVALLRTVREKMAEGEVMVLDAGFGLNQLREAGAQRYVLRMAKNFTARRNALPVYKGTGRPPEYGEIVRPLPRQKKGKLLEATPPDKEETFIDSDCIIRVQYWDDLVARSEKVGAADSFTCAVIHDPRYRNPLVATYSIEASGAAVRKLYRDRWPVEVIPQTAKQILGAHRQYVFAETSRHRLPELALLSGAILGYLAATQDEAIPTGFWDRRPQHTPGRLRRVLARVSFSMLGGFAEEVRGKSSRTDHLPKGVDAHRRHKAPAPAVQGDRLAA